MIIIPSGIHLPPEYGRRKLAPSYIPRAPLCMKCGREATVSNPVGITLRKAWAGMNCRRLDAICAECREKMGGR